MSKKRRGTVAVDFDGVINSYASGYTHDLPDPPVDGAIEWLEMLMDTFSRVVIFTARINQTWQERAIREWLIKWGMDEVKARAIDITRTKPPAMIYIDDRGFRFEGVFPNADEITALADPWFKRGGPQEAA